MGDFADDYNGVNNYVDYEDTDINESLRDSGRYHLEIELEDEDLDGLDDD